MGDPLEKTVNLEKRAQAAETAANQLKVALEKVTYDDEKARHQLQQLIAESSSAQRQLQDVQSTFTKTKNALADLRVTYKDDVATRDNAITELQRVQNKFRDNL